MSNESAFAKAGQLRELRRADDAGRRAGEQRERRVRRGLVERREAARRAHHERLRQLGRGACLGEGAEIAREHRAEVGVDRRRRGALVLAELRRDLVRGDDVRVRVAAAQLGGDGALRLAVAEREEQRDGDRVGVDLRERGEVERDELACGAGSAAHAEAALERDERRRMLRARPVEVRPRLAAEVQDVLEALVRDEGGPRAAPLEQRVRRDRRPVREAVDVLGAGCARSRDDRLLLSRGGRDLRDPDVPVRQEDGVRERPPDVDSERAHAGIRTRTPG